MTKYHSEDEDCLLAGKPLKKFDLKISTVIPFDTLGIRLVLKVIQMNFYTLGERTALYAHQCTECPKKTPL